MGQDGLPFPLTPPWWGNIIRCPSKHLDPNDDVVCHDRRAFVIQTGNTSTLKEYTVEESLKIFREAGFTKLEMARGHLLLCKTHELRRAFAVHAEELGLSMGCLNAVGENYFEPFGTDEQKQRSLEAMKGDMEMALSLGTTDMMIWEGRAPIWSPEPKTVITDFFTIGRNYGASEQMNMKVLYMCGHAGTHLDAPKHLRQGKPSLDEVPLSRSWGGRRSRTSPTRDSTTPGSGWSIFNLWPRSWGKAAGS